MSTATLSEEYIKEILSKVATILKLKNWSHNLETFESMGQNYFGLLMPVTISGTDVDKDCELNYRIVLKLAPIDERYRVSGAVTIMFQREIFVYTELLTKYQKLLVEISSPLFHIPALYYARDEYCKEVIAMRDMRELGFETFTRNSFLDLDHITVALESLARLHALSFHLKTKDRGLYDKAAKVCVPLTENTNKRFMDIMIDRLKKALSKFQGTECQPLLEKLETNCALFFEKAVRSAKDTCVCHGDIWKENILFCYESHKPTSACIIDYQTTRISSPAFDTLYLIISSTDTKLRNNNFHKLLDIYYRSFQKMLEAFHLDSNVIYSRDLLNEDLKLVAPACFIVANTALWLSSGLQEEGHVRSKKVWNTPEEKSQAVHKYKAAISGIIKDFYTYGYLPEKIL